MSITCSRSVNGRQGYKAGISAAYPTVALVRNPAPVAALADSEDMTHVVGVLNKGAKEYIPTNLPLEDAVEAIRLVAAGGVFAPARCLATSSESGAAGARDATKQIFTARQAAIVNGVRKGKANKTIAYELNLRESTIKVHIRNMMKKLNAKNRTEVAYIATNLENAGWLSA
jgi:DNA-binding NarL/FixJ family response regulator